jgi:hypothetical protein
MKRKSKLDPKIFKEGKFTIKNFILAIDFFFDIFEIYNNKKLERSLKPHFFPWVVAHFEIGC